MFELHEAGVPCTLIVDSAAAITMQRKSIVAVVVGADRIAINGDTANKIGTYGVAIAAAHHAIPFYVAAPRSTIDFALDDGAGIPIEEHDRRTRAWRHNRGPLPARMKSRPGTGQQHGLST